MTSPHRTAPILVAGLSALWVSVLLPWAVAASPTAPGIADRIVVHKKDRIMELMHQGQVLKTYKIALGGQPVGAKTRQGDHRTPEGVYITDRRKAHSQFHRALHISYPYAADRQRARKLGVSPGGDIFIHGLPNGYGWIGSEHRARDWTDGCIAVTDQEIEEIWRLVGDGTPVEIRP
jgi:murein L,D-transpeptidase YafK